MRIGELLRQLDQRLLPPLGRVLTARRATWSGLVGWVTLVCLVVVGLTAAWVTRGPSLGDRTVGEVTRVGVAEGDSIPGYLRSAGAELAALPDPAPSAGSTWALVSLVGYLPPERLTPVLGDVPVAAVFGRVPLPGRQTEIVRIPAVRVPEDVRAGMGELADRKEREAADYRARSAAVSGAGARERELRQLYDSGAEVAAAEAAAYRAGCSCLYAAVVRAEPSRLRTVAARTGVRVVDPAPEVTRLDRAVFTPPLPEQDDQVRPPADDGVPTGLPSPSVGPVSPPSASPRPASPQPTSPQAADGPFPIATPEGTVGSAPAPAAPTGLAESGGVATVLSASSGAPVDGAIDADDSGATPGER